MIMKEVVYNFNDKESEEKMYKKIKKRLIKNGYKPIGTYVSYDNVCSVGESPYTLKIKYHTQSNTQNKEYKPAA